MNNTKHCFDGGDCTYKYAVDYREPCNDYECCSPVPVEESCGMYNFTITFVIFTMFGKIYFFVMFWNQVWEEIINLQAFDHESSSNHLRLLGLLSGLWKGETF